MTKIILQGIGLTSDSAQKIAEKYDMALNIKNSYYQLHKNIQISSFNHDDLNNLRVTYPFDINLLPHNYNPNQIKLFISDMDSTLINVECIDEIADYVGKKKEVSKITESAMRGELDFKDSLTQRVRLLAGVSEYILQKIYETRIRLNPGGRELLSVLKQKNIRIALVSGGFTYFTDLLKQKYDLNFTLANTLEIKNGKLTGEVTPPIVDATTKAQFLLYLCKELQIETSQVIAIGDGANDLEMLKTAGLGIAYHAKEKVQKSAQIVLNHCSLDGVLPFIGY
ncbi:phosphoserine phosphatase SerB [Candidatus Nitrosacidococcus sp. I8]|uniref:phosphoserine phosphatase SerB n=1 Tax=Candidatus Nitrosacidococcus sp. I8 TaxID=2942908 RepID=UPI0022272B79|nr:phosphoserine phosphatase SerB [Candidatus Nitrosacidococcus sp. I8]CAH9019092.1 2-hydroxy-3-keto-5-methylthiopentenyl-1-phosphatephosphatase [Candidatus Nitrosacidococcus sp. I8]